MTDEERAALKEKMQAKGNNGVVHVNGSVGKAYAVTGFVLGIISTVIGATLGITPSSVIAGSNDNGPLVLMMLGVIIALISGVTGCVTIHIARKQGHHSGIWIAGRILSVVGIWLVVSYIVLMLIAIFIDVYVMMSGFSAGRDTVGHTINITISQWLIIHLIRILGTVFFIFRGLKKGTVSKYNKR